MSAQGRTLHSTFLKLPIHLEGRSASHGPSRDALFPVCNCTSCHRPLLHLFQPLASLLFLQLELLLLHGFAFAGPALPPEIQTAHSYTPLGSVLGSHICSEVVPLILSTVLHLHETHPLSHLIFSSWHLPYVTYSGFYVLKVLIISSSLWPPYIPRL